MPVNPQPAPGEQSNPYLPTGPQPIVFEIFEGLNTNASRAGIKDEQMYWCDGFMPVGPNLLRTLPGVGPVLYAPGGSLTIPWFNFGNIGTTAFTVVLLSDGSLVQVNTSTRLTTQIAPAGTIQNPSMDNIGLSQWAAQYILIVTNQENGYFVWDGASLFQAGTLAPNVSISNGGSGYTSAPTVSVSGGSGSGSSLTAIVTNEIVTSISVVNPGSGYLIGDTPTITFTGGGGSGASASIVIMPFGIQGTTIETYTSRVWIANGPKVTFSAPGTFSDFATSLGGGTFTSTDSFLRNRFVQLVQSNGFLYLVADSSINYISGVQTSGTPPTTTFTNQNADPEIGTPWGVSVDTFSRNILLANPFGIHVSYGGAVTKISEPLDGFYNTVPNFGGFLPSAAKAIIYAKKVYMVLLPVVDQITGQTSNKLLMWDSKKWWTSSQDVNLNYIQHQEIDSVITAYGTDGSQMWPLFQTPTTGFTKRVQSKLWAQPGYWFMKSMNRLWGLVNVFDSDIPSFDVILDNGSGPGATYPITVGPTGVSLINVNNASVSLINALSQPVTLLNAGVGITTFAPEAVGQNGVLNGITLETTGADLAVISLAFKNDITAYRG